MKKRRKSGKKEGEDRENE
jgi:hypothetical protein